MLKRYGLVVLIVGVLALAAAPAEASVVWDGDATKGTKVFALIGSNCASPGGVTAVDDSSRGKVWRFRKPSGSDRCENRGIANNGTKYHFANGGTYYLGWSSKLSNTVNNNATFQWKSYGDHIQNWPVVLKMIGGSLTMIQRQPDGVVHTIWSKPVSANAWNHIVVGLKLSDQTTGGWVELWFNGVKQTFNNGSQRWACRTWDSLNDPKWGVYGAETPVSTTIWTISRSAPPTPMSRRAETRPTRAPTRRGRRTPGTPPATRFPTAAATTDASSPTPPKPAGSRQTYRPCGRRSSRCG